MGDAPECVFNSVHRIVLSGCFDVSNQEISVDGVERETDQDVELEWSPVFNGNGIGLVWSAHD